MENAALCGKVTTDEQIEILRRQIAAYATICEQLAEMHRETALRQESFTGMGTISSSFFVLGLCNGGSMWKPQDVCEAALDTDADAASDSGEHLLPRELAALRSSKQGIKDITAKLAEHGQISETNVYNWFQNRRARSKTKQQANAQSEEEEAESLKPEKARTA